MASSKVAIPWSNPLFGSDELNQIKDCFISQRFTSGEKVKQFEQKISKFLNTKYAIAVTNGTIALDLALKSVGVKRGDEVIVPAITYFSTASAVSYQNATPVFVDINDDYNIDTNKIEEAIGKKTKAIIYIDYGGKASNIDKINQIGRKYKINIIQDGAQSLGGIYNN